MGKDAKKQYFRQKPNLLRQSYYFYLKRQVLFCKILILKNYFFERLFNDSQKTIHEIINSVFLAFSNHTIKKICIFAV